jgi:hypothetical protein
MGLLWYTRERLGDCVLRIVYRVLKDGSNSGIFIRVAEPPPDPMYAVHHGYEVQILDSETSPFHRTGAIYSLAPATVAAMRPTGEWNEMDIRMRGERVDIRLNGVEVTHFDPQLPVPPRQHGWEPQLGPRPTKGFIGLQNHGGDESEVFFKDVLVQDGGG